MTVRGVQVLDASMPLAKLATPVIQQLESTDSIDLKSTGTTTILTVPTGKTAVVTCVVVRCTAATAITDVAAAAIDTSTETLYGSRPMTGLDTSGDVYLFNEGGRFVTLTAGTVLRLNVGTAAQGTTQTASVDVIGFFVGANGGEATIFGQSASVNQNGGGTDTIPTNTFTTITYDTEEFDTNSMANLGTNDDRLTFQTAGVYLVHGALRMGFQASIEFLLNLQRYNSGDTLQEETRQSNSNATTNTPWLNGSAIWSCSAGDYVIMRAFQTGASKTTSGDKSTSLKAFRLGVV